MADAGAAEPPSTRDGAFADSRADAIPVVQVEGFAGQLDVLLALARSRGIDLAQVSIRDLVDQLVAAAQERLAAPLPRRADWLVMASWLALLKSQLLLPDPKAAAAAEQEAEATRERLLEKARMQAAARWLEARPRLGRDLFARGAPEFFPRRPEGDIAGLLRVCLWLIRKPVAQPPAERRAPRRFWRTPDAIARIAAILAERPEGGELLEFLPPLPALDTAAGERTIVTRAAIASTLVAALELARRGAAVCDQVERFGSLHVQGGGFVRHKGDAAGL